ncbi:MAG: hypothetical protein AAB733_00570 [Patescibacteria group bacterium]
MQKPSRLILLGIVAALVLSLTAAGVVYLYAVRRAPEKSVANDNSNANSAIHSSGTLPTINGTASSNTNEPLMASVSGQSETEKLLRDQSALFAERFGSYSNNPETAYDNIRDLTVFMTSSMQKWSEQFISGELAVSSNPGIYYGISTEARAASLLTLDENGGTASVLVSTQRRETKGEPSVTSTFNQDLELTFVKEDSFWRVNQATWK